MTQERLRELLRERVADETMADCSGQAWQAARVARRRRRLGAAAGVVAATVGVAGVTAVVDSPPTTPRHPLPGTSTPAAPKSGPDATYRGIPVWWSPDQHEEQELPAIGSPLPVEIDLGVTTPLGEAPMQRAVAAFARGTTVVLVPPEGGELRTVDVSRLDDVTKPNGYSYFPTGTAMLSPHGDYLVFPQQDHLAVLTIATGAWSDVDTGDATTLYPVWTGELSLVLVSGPGGRKGPLVDVTSGVRADEIAVADAAPLFAGDAQAYGPSKFSPAQNHQAQAWGMGVPLPLRDASAYLSAPEFLTVDGAALAFMDELGDGQDTRFKQCCPVAGWLDEETVVYESRQTRALLVAWTVGTDRFQLVSRILGSYDVASFGLDR